MWQYTGRKGKGFGLGVFCLVFLLGAGNLLAREKEIDGAFALGNSLVEVKLLVHQGTLTEESFSWKTRDKEKGPFFATDGNFALNVMWTGWRAPGKLNNAENPVVFAAQDFRVDSVATDTSAAGGRRLVLFLLGRNNPFSLTITYRLGRKDFFYRRELAVWSTKSPLHFLRKVDAVRAKLLVPADIRKKGGFGQPVAFGLKQGGVFAGLEYPASQNTVLQRRNGGLVLRCSEEIGRKVTRKKLQIHAVVIGLSPERAVKRWFFRYLDTIRVHPLRPYLLYNTWYDLRAPEMVRDSLRIMNERNILRIIRLFRKNMVRPFGVRLNAFVLDDGWDVYRSDWRLRPEQFPHGLGRIADSLAADGTALGMWLGPIGGYSHRDWRIGWMKKHGYETVGGELCVAGKKYHRLLKKRTVDFVKRDGVAYFKWDGIQFSCSEPDHGHPVGIYSRRAVLDSLIDLCQAVRRQNRNVFLNITSGTWLSPWWLQYADQIWMQGSDYGYANVPSISRRDAAITYRDYVLYDDFSKIGAWFPVSNLMTHGIIKGNLQKLGGEREPLDKFTDNALLYFARGVSMWELYISPDLLNKDEWRAIVKSVLWAKDRFNLLKNTVMVGGNPGERKPYGYLHARGERAILAARNPYILPDTLWVTLDAASGLSERAASLVLERVYPTRWISPELYAAGGRIPVPLEGYETAIYEIYPVQEADWPLVAGVVFEQSWSGNRTARLRLLRQTDRIRVLNPEWCGAIRLDGRDVSFRGLAELRGQMTVSPVSGRLRRTSRGTKLQFEGQLAVPSGAKKVRLAVLVESPNGAGLPEINFLRDGKEVRSHVESRKNTWSWSWIPLPAGRTKLRIRLKGWRPDQKISFWGIGLIKGGGKTLTVTAANEAGTVRVMPPVPWPAGYYKMRVPVQVVTEK